MKLAKEQAIELVNEYVGYYFNKKDVEKATRVQPNDQFGDVAVEVSNLEKIIGLPPKEFAEMFVDGEPPLGDIFESVEAVVGKKVNFINFRLNRTNFVERTLAAIREQRESYGSNNIGDGQLAVFDYSAPNIGKPLHVGHIRSTILGDSIIRLMQFSGYRTHGINYLGDVGLHIGKILHAFKNEGSMERLQEDPERELLDLYVSFCKREEKDASLTELAKDEVQLVERGNERTVQLLELITRYSLESFDRVYELLNMEIDETTGQSHFSDRGKALVYDAEKRGIVERTEDGALVMPLQRYGLPNKVVLRSDGTAIYSTQDIGAAVERYEQHQFDRMLYIVGEAQATYFQQLFKMLKVMGYEWADNCEHVGFGLIKLKEGKMATREGAVVYLEELLRKAIGRAGEIIEEKNPDLHDKDSVAGLVGIGAVKYQILNVDKLRDIQFSWEKALDFEGKSAPYIQYTSVRASSILRKAGGEGSDYPVIIDHLLGEGEYQLVRKMAQFPLAVEAAVQSLRPNIIANYAYELSGTFNILYNSVKILEDPEKRESRLALMDCYKTVIGNAMGLLGIQIPEEM